MGWLNESHSDKEDPGISEDSFYLPRIRLCNLASCAVTACLVPCKVAVKQTMTWLLHVFKMKHIFFKTTVSMKNKGHDIMTSLKPTWRRMTLKSMQKWKTIWFGKWEDVPDTVDNKAYIWHRKRKRSKGSGRSLFGQGKGIDGEYQADTWAWQRGCVDIAWFWRQCKASAVPFHTLFLPL